MTKFSPGQYFAPGFLAVPDASGGSDVKFGGDRWVSEGGAPEQGAPALLLTVDLASPAFASVLPRLPAIELPLFSHINLEGMLQIQGYRLDQASRTAIFDAPSNYVNLLPIEDRLPIPLPASGLKIQEMRTGEIPVDEDSYWEALETFLGGHGFIRILGKPVFIENITDVGDDFVYFASIGCERFDQPSGILGQEPFYLGELAHYFYVSKDWSRIKVISQAS